MTGGPESLPMTTPTIGRLIAHQCGGGASGAMKGLHAGLA
jgi:hypothetical protein